MVKLRLSARGLVAALLFLAPFCLQIASAQDFTLSASTPNPPALEPGGGTQSVATISVGGSGAVVNLTCTQIPAATASAPTCTPGASPVTAPASVPVTLAAPKGTVAGAYTFQVEGSDGSGKLDVTVAISILAVTPEYTISVTTPVSPSSVNAGSGATAVVTVTPINGYTGKITLSCSNVSPAAVPPPTCSFNPEPLDILSSGAETSTLTITTYGPATTTTAQARPARSDSRWIYALWLGMPGLGLLTFGFVRGPQRKRWLGFLLLNCVIGTLLFVPACGSSSTTTTTTTAGTTPKNTYTLTITGADDNSPPNAPSNGTLTVSLMVN